MATYKNLCPFCNKNDSPPSREDILAKWMTDEFPSLIWEVTDINTKQSYKTKKNLGLITKRPCRRCNNEWMSQLETAVKPILQPLMKGTPTTLTLRQQSIIAVWFLKTVMNFDLLGEKKRPCYFEPHERHALMKSRAVPSHTQMFLAKYKGSKDSIVRETHIELARWTGDPNPDPSSLIRGYAVTLTIKHLVLQIFCARGLPDGVAYNMVDYSSAYTQIAIGSVAGWPPPERFDDEGLNFFTERWLHLEPPP